MYIKMNDDKSLIITVPTTIYRGEKNSDMITFLVPNYHEDVNMADCKMLMRYIIPSGVGYSDTLVYCPELYKDYLQYTIPVDTKLTAEQGDVCVWLTAFNSENDLVLKSGEVSVPISRSRNIDAYLPPNTLSQLDDIEMRVTQLEETDVVYVPHISGNKVLTWTIEDVSGEVPEPVDLNPADEWSTVEGEVVVSDYIWESI